jgi:pimeloyl-ACP methyl ester carboxylesterase
MRISNHRLPGLVLSGHEFQVPLDHARPDGEQIVVFGREVVSPGREDADLPWLLFLQGGPGFPAPRPEARDGWLKRALQSYRVFLLDQRGTGRSTPVTHQTLARLPSPRAQADYLKHFRADSIVQDAEWIRRELLGRDGRWTVLGQSYGGFCLAHYLSVAPTGLSGGIFTGGIPPLTNTPDEVYRATYRRVRERNRRYYGRYPEDIALAREIVDRLGAGQVILPTGDPLTPRRFQQLGLAFGASNGFEQVHYLLEQAFVPGLSGRELSHGFLRGVENAFAFDTNPLFAILHEAIYCQQAASNWSAQRMRAEFPEFDLSPGAPVYFTGEMIYPWMFDEYRHLRPLKEAAELLAAHDGWPPLYDGAGLEDNTVPCVAAVYDEDMYVERTLSDKTASHIRGLRCWVTNQYDHNGLRAHGEVILDRLLAMLHGEI